MVKVLVGSENPAKIQSVREAFSHYFTDLEVLGIRVPSGVPDQPINLQTFDGAKNRALALKEINDEQNMEADFFVGIEGGITNSYGLWFSCGAMCIINKNEKISFGVSHHFQLPQNSVNELLGGVELGHIAARFTGDPDSKKKGGMFGFLTKGVMGRKELYVQGLISALIPFVNEGLYFD